MFSFSFKYGIGLSESENKLVDLLYNSLQAFVNKKNGEPPPAAAPPPAHLPVLAQAASGLNTQKADKNLGIGAEMEYITDIEAITECGILPMPATVINDKAVAFGNVRDATETENLPKG